MQNDSQTVSRSGLLLSLIVFGLAAVLIAVPNMFRSKAGNSGKGLVQRTESHVPGLENYDIRADKSAFEKLAGFRASSGKDASLVADIRQSFVDGENALKTKVPTLKVEYNSDIRTPEVIAPDVKQGRNFLTNSSGQNRAEILRNFVRENNSLIGVSDAQTDALKVTADYTNPDGNLSFAHLEQLINDVPVFRGEVKAGFTKNGELIRVINNLAPGLDYESLSTDFRNPTDAVRSAFRYINSEPTKLDIERNDAASNDLKVVFGNGDWATTAEKMYFPTEPGVARTAWRVLIWQPVNAFYVIIDAETGTMLWRKNIGEDQTQPATYDVYTNSNAMINSADSPAPLTPGIIDPTTGTQGAIIPRNSVSLIGNEAPNQGMNNLGWITDGANITDGNNLEAGIDRIAPNGVDAPQPGDGACPGAGCRVFTSTWNPPPGNPTPGDAPLTAPAQRGAVIQMFYIMNLYHDTLYSLGFTEAARNFQTDNFGRGGVGNDRVSAEGQDSSGSNNANFNTPADGGRGRMQMYIWTGPTPDYDGTTDADIIIHEVTHGLSNRLHGNASGLSSNMSRGMGEGWSDYYAHSLLSEPSDPINGIYTTGGYATYLGAGGFTSNYYHGIRRFPKAVLAFTGGPNNRPHNPMTFADTDSTQFNIGDGAYPRGPFGSSTVDQVHNLGEIWSSALWEVRAKMVTRLGWANGNRKTLQFVTDGMKLAPLGPTFLQERDAIIAAAQASPAIPEAGADVADIWAGFAIRGMGFSAVVNAAGSGANNTRVTEAFDLPNLVQTPELTVSDSTGDGDGFPEPGEPLIISVPLTNNTGNNATGTTLQLVGGGSANYGTINNGQTAAQNVSYTVPSNTQCGSAITLTFNVNSSLGATSFTRTIIIGVPQTTFTENFDGVTAPVFPAGWTAVSVQTGIIFVNSPLNPDTAPNSAYALDPTTVGGGTDLTSPTIPITASAAKVSFRNRFNTEAGWDGGVLDISINGGAFQDIITAGGRFIQNGYNGTLGAGVNNPLANRMAWNGDSSGYINTTVQLPASAAGQNVQFKWRFGADDNTTGSGANPGWYVDGVNIVGNYSCSFVPGTAEESRADFDGDGRTDLSVFRPGEGNWYLQKSTAGFAAINWGTSGDVLVPGDYDNDGKADTAVFRASNTMGVADFYILNSGGFTFSGYEWGSTGDIPVVGDYDGDGKTDVAVFRPSTNQWYIINSGGSPANTITVFGQAGDVPVVGDFNGDGKSDLTVYRSGVYMSQLSGGGTQNRTIGTTGDQLVPADYDGDDKDDAAVFRPSTGQWIYIASNGGATVTTAWGAAGDVPVPGDYDGDGTDDFAIYRNGQWWLLRSTSGALVSNFGLSSDSPIPNAYIP
ncbi:hypothetical protein BH20ACI4_BH20ACI4_08000 [soil metagenome]